MLSHIVCWNCNYAISKNVIIVRTILYTVEHQTLHSNWMPLPAPVLCPKKHTSKSSSKLPFVALTRGSLLRGILGFKTNHPNRPNQPYPVDTFEATIKREFVGNKTRSVYIILFTYGLCMYRNCSFGNRIGDITIYVTTVYNIDIISAAQWKTCGTRNSAELRKHAGFSMLNFSSSSWQQILWCCTVTT